MTKKATLTYPIKEDHILLKKAIRGPSKGKWNGVGGWIEPRDMTAEDSATREIREETNLLARSLFYHGDMRVHMDGSKIPDFVVYLYSSKDLIGKAIPSKEGAIQWYPLDKIPYDEMLEDNKHCIPLILDKKRFDIDLWVKKDGHIYQRHEITPTE